MVGDGGRSGSDRSCSPGDSPQPYPLGLAATAEILQYRSTTQHGRWGHDSDLNGQLDSAIIATSGKLGRARQHKARRAGNTMFSNDSHACTEGGKSGASIICFSLRSYHGSIRCFRAKDMVLAPEAPVPGIRGAGAIRGTAP